MKKTKACTIYTDGGARGNPGPAAAGGVIVGSRGAVLAEVSEFLGVTTNNVAEYRALILTLQRALDMGCSEIEVCMDSELVVRQLSGLYRVKDAKMRPLHAHATTLLEKFATTRVRHIPRTENKRADKLVNAILDAHATAQREASVGL